MTSEATDRITGEGLRRAFRLAFDQLEEYRDTVNALNVFPVPDGDTGTNMSLTLRSGVERCPDDDEVTAGQVAGELAQGTFFGARGNSGVILSQFFKGFSDALQGNDTCSAGDLANALDMARVAAYGAVGTPREGTMLTVIRCAAEAALEVDGSDFVSVLATAYAASCVALKNTPEQLPVLKEAGVVDSGGLGVVVILGGALEAVAPERSRTVSAETGLNSIIDSSMASLGESGQAQDQGFVHSSLEEAWGYCTEFIISGEGLSTEDVRRYCEEMGRSTVVVGDSRNVRVHVHMEDPGAAISYGVALGVVSNVKVENMDQQNVEWAAGHSAAPAPSVGASLTVVSVAAGRGLAGLFSESGCGFVIEGGQTMNPSVQQIMQGVERAGAEHTIFLPNNKNIVLTAQQVAANDPTVHVVPTRSVPQGVAAMLAYNPLSTLEENLAAMEEVLPTVTTIEITQAVRDTSVDGVEVALGDFIALLDDQLVLTAESAEDALQRAVAQTGADSSAILTVYRGADTSADAADECVEALEASILGLQVDQLYGGQPHYHYLASIE